MPFGVSLLIMKVMGRGDFKKSLVYPFLLKERNLI
jgi:hypothetical protein